MAAFAQLFVKGGIVHLIQCAHQENARGMVVGILLYYATQMLQCLVVEAFGLPYVVYDLLAHVVVLSVSLLRNVGMAFTSWLPWS